MSWEYASEEGLLVLSFLMSLLVYLRVISFLMGMLFLSTTLSFSSLPSINPS